MSIREEEEAGTNLPAGRSPRTKEQQQMGTAEGSHVPDDLKEKDKDKGPFYGKTTDPEALYDKRRIIDEG